MTELCVTLRERTIKGAIEAARRCQSIGIGLVEIRLDQLDTVNWTKVDQRRISELCIRNILTLRPKWEGGLFSGDEAGRIEILRSIIRTRPDFIDIEVRTEERSREELIGIARENDVASILSHHDRSKTPGTGELEVILQKGYDTGGDMVKLATRCESIDDSSCLIKLAMKHKPSGKRYSIMGMGPFGHVTRVLAPILGCEMVYTKLDDSFNEDQIDARTLKGIWDAIGLGGSVDRR